MIGGAEDFSAIQLCERTMSVKNERDIAINSMWLVQ